MNFQRLIGLVPVAFGAYFLFRAVMAALRLQRIVSTETTPIARARGGLVELKGTVLARELVTSPLSGRACVWYSYAVHEHRGNGRKRAHWVKLRSGTEGREFVVADESGRALVRPKGADVVLDPDVHGRSGTFQDPTPDLQTFLRRVGVDSTGLFGFNRNLKVTESFLSDGDAIYVLGAARRCGPAEAGDTGATIVVDDRGPDFVLSDKDETGLRWRLVGEAVGLGLLAALLAGFGAVLLTGRLGSN